MNVGNKIKEARVLIGLTQKELAEKLHLPASSIGRWESNEFKPSPKNIKKLAEFFNKDMSYFLDEKKATLSVDQLSDLLNQLPQNPNQNIRESINFAMTQLFTKFPPVTAIAHAGVVIFTNNNAIPSEGNQMRFTVKCAEDTAYFKNGDMLVFDTAAAPKHGSLVIIEHNGVYTIVTHSKNTTGRVIATAVFKSI